MTSHLSKEINSIYKEYVQKTVITTSNKLKDNLYLKIIIYKFIINNKVGILYFSTLLTDTS